MNYHMCLKERIAVTYFPFLKPPSYCHMNWQMNWSKAFSFLCPGEGQLTFLFIR